MWQWKLGNGSRQIIKIVVNRDNIPLKVQYAIKGEMPSYNPSIALTHNTRFNNHCIYRLWFFMSINFMVQFYSKFQVVIHEKEFEKITVHLTITNTMQHWLKHSSTFVHTRRRQTFEDISFARLAHNLQVSVCLSFIYILYLN